MVHEIFLCLLINKITILFIAFNKIDLNNCLLRKQLFWTINVPWKIQYASLHCYHACCVRVSLRVVCLMSIYPDSRNPPLIHFSVGSTVHLPQTAVQWLLPLMLSLYTLSKRCFHGSNLINLISMSRGFASFFFFLHILQHYVPHVSIKPFFFFFAIVDLLH